ncbi:MAG TPA: DUF6306 domain-containing protein [Anaerolineales bacterium]|nr:DUF6306 domain-containing protein [Anaerolineales bacterium]
MSREIIDRLNELLECERAGVEVAMRLATSDARGFTEGELKKFAEDEGLACGGLRKAILRFGGTPLERTGDFSVKVMALPTEGERVSLLARGQAWVVRRTDALLAKDLDPETRAFLVEMRDQHLENVEACHRRAEELQAPPSPPYRGLPFGHLMEAHDRLYYGAWRSPVATERDFQRAYRQVERYLAVLALEIDRSRGAEARESLKKAEDALARTDPDRATALILGLDNAVSYAHRSLNALLRQYRIPNHDPTAFGGFYDVAEVPFRESI